MFQYSYRLFNIIYYKGRSIKVLYSLLFIFTSCGINNNLDINALIQNKGIIIYEDDFSKNMEH